MTEADIEIILERAKEMHPEAGPRIISEESAPPVIQLGLIYIRNGYSIGAWRRGTRRKLH